MDDNADKELEYPRLPREATTYVTKRGIEQMESFVIIHGRRIALFDQKHIPKVDEDGTPRKPLKIRYEGRVYRCDFEILRGHKTCGQLMGQATSFPLLCLVNLAATIAAYRRVGVGWRDALSMVIINGDDRLADSDRKTEDHFWELASSVGLHRSPGKSHEHPDYCCINAQDYVRAGDIWKRVPAIRSHLIFGLKKLQSDEFRPTQVITALFESVPFFCQRRTIQTFLRLHARKIEKEAFGRNLFLPVALGGSGQERPVLWKDSVTPFQFSVAEKLIRQTPFLDYSFGPKIDEIARPNPTGNPWDQVTAAPVEPWTNRDNLELESFQKRVTRRHLTSDLPLLATICRCGSVRYQGKSKCNRPGCFKPARRCPADLGSWRSILQRYRCTDCYDRWGEPVDDRPCVHGDEFGFIWVEKRSYGCQCHGDLDEPVGERQPFSEQDLRACFRPVLVGTRQRPERAALSRERKMRTWENRLVDLADPLLVPWKIPLPK